MRCLTLLAILILTLLACCARAGKVSIKGTCVDCHTDETTTRRPSPTRGRPTSPKPKPKTTRKSNSNKNSDEDSAEGWMLSQGANGAQTISRGGRYKRQRYQSININGLDDHDGGWNGGRVTTIDTRGRPGTYVRNDDCVGCNIRG